MSVFFILPYNSFFPSVSSVYCRCMCAMSPCLCVVSPCMCVRALSPYSMRMCMSLWKCVCVMCVCARSPCMHVYVTMFVCSHVWVCFMLPCTHADVYVTTYGSVCYYHVCACKFVPCHHVCMCLCMSPWECVCCVTMYVCVHSLTSFLPLTQNFFKHLAFFCLFYCF